jgi:hypothetical protein
MVGYGLSVACRGADGLSSAALALRCRCDFGGVAADRAAAHAQAATSPRRLARMTVASRHDSCSALPFAERRAPSAERRHGVQASLLMSQPRSSSGCGR